MFGPKLRTRLVISMLTLSLAGISAFAQQPAAPQTTSPTVPQTTTVPGQGIRRAMRRRAFGRMVAVFHQLNLTDAQKQQVRTIVKTTMESTKAQRQQLATLNKQWRQGTLTPDSLTTANQLHQQLAQARKSMRTQIEGVLTPDQKTKLQDIIKQRNARKAANSV